MVVNNPHIQVGDMVKPRYRLIQFKQKFLEILSNRKYIKTHDELENLYKHICNTEYICTKIHDKFYEIESKSGWYCGFFIPKQLLKKC